MKVRSKVLCGILGIAFSVMAAGCGGQTGNTDMTGAGALENMSEEAGVRAAENVSEEAAEVASEENSGESLVTNGGENIPFSALEHQDKNADAVVYYLSDISPEAMVEIYEALVKRNNISYNMSLPIWRAIFLPCPKKPYSAGFAVMQ